MKTFKEINEVIVVNRERGRSSYENLSSSEIGEYNRVLMFGENWEAFPTQEEWSLYVD